jgi:hypothetical protein
VVRACMPGAGDENQIRTISLGIGRIGVGMLRDLPSRLAVSDRNEPLSQVIIFTGLPGTGKATGPEPAQH